MSEAGETLGSSESAVQVELAQRTSRVRSSRQLFATVLSAACPGTGHLILGQLPKGMALSALFAVLLCGFWPLRLLRYYPGLLVLFVGWIVLGLYSACSTQLIRSPKSEGRVSKWWFALTVPVTLIIISLAGAMMTRVAGFRSFAVPSTSMEPLIQPGDRIVVDTRAFRSNSPQYRDVMVCYKDGTFFIKRIIGIGGDTVEGRADRILLNGTLINESYVRHSRPQSEIDWQTLGHDSMQSFGPVTVPAGKYFVMGDNRDVSLDSRSPTFGLISANSILGKVLYVYATTREGLRVR